VNRKRLIIGIVIALALVCITLSIVGVSWWRKYHQPKAYQRTLVSRLVYCSSDNLKPCIESFSIDADGNMLVNLLVPDSSYPDFYLTISDASTTNRYECQQVKDFPTNIYCTGMEMYPGATLQFTLIALKDDNVLAEGKFAIIGLQLPNPQEEFTATPSLTEAPAMTEAPIETPTPFIIEIFTPLPNASSTPSYPNPSYP